MENDYMMSIVSVEIDRDAEAEDSAESQNESTQSSSRVDEEDSNLDESVGWTNEKHNSYLDYLESSFVKQLYSLLGGETRTLSRTRDVRSKSHKSADQFMVIQTGCWQKVNIEKKRDRIQKTSPGHEYPAQSTAEASGQNFREVEEEEKECNSEVSRKRKREAKFDDSSFNDQVKT
ncbi:unnamed protein product [Cochlearia groenlandica]